MDVDFVKFFGAVWDAAEVPRKEKGGAYARLIFLGLVGWHMFYLEKPRRGFLYLLSFAMLMFGWVPVEIDVKSGFVSDSYVSIEEE